jgi:hypothetical protein
MKKQCPKCRKIVDFAVSSCDGCQLAFFGTRPVPKDLTNICMTIGGVVFIAASVIVTIVLHQ